MKVIAFIFFAFGPLGSLGKEEACEGQQCKETAETAGSALLQKRALLGRTSLEMSDEKYHLVKAGDAVLYRLVLKGFECRSSDKYMGKRTSAQECADAVKAAGGHFFAFGTGRKAGKCYMENTAGAACTEGFKYYPSYDFYALEMEEEKVARKKAEKEAADAVTKKAPQGSPQGSLENPGILGIFIHF